MSNLKQRLPPLEPLVAFEAAARHGSFALAARELHVTASAISQQIRVLERSLQQALFDRGHRSVTLTEAGEKFYNGVRFALTHLLAAADATRSPSGPPELKLALDTSMASLWLMPRLSQLQIDWPALSLKVLTSDSESELFDSDFELALLHGNGCWQGYEASALFSDIVFPVCAPDYYRKHADKIDDHQLHRCALLDLDYQHWNWMNWTIWLTEAGLPLPARPIWLQMNHYPLLVEAARQGAGIALGWQYLIEDDLRAGTLCRITDYQVSTDNAYYIVRPYNVSHTTTAQRFHDWVIEECSAK